MNKTIPISESISFGWKSVKENIGTFVLASVILFLPGLLSEIIAGGAENAAAGLVGLIFNIITVGLMLGMIKLSLDVVKGEKPEIKNMFGFFNKALISAIGAYILYFLAMIPVAILGFLAFGAVALSIFGGSGISLLLTIVFGILAAAAAVYVTLRFFLFLYAIAGEGAKAMDSMRISSEATAGRKMGLAGFVILISLINLLGAILLLVGLLVTFPLTIIATAYLYNHLRSPEATPVSTQAPAEEVTEPAEAESETGNQA